MKYRYVSERNPDGDYLPGVPLRDLSADEVANLPPADRAALDRLPFYERQEKDSEEIDGNTI